MQKKVLITGGAGFVGSSIAINLKKRYPAYTVICLDNLKRRGSELNITRLTGCGVQFVHGDIRNKEDLEAVASGITTIIEASAEPAVLAGINSSPEYLVNTNLLGTINCLYLAAKVKADLVFLSTSRVYPIDGIEQIAFDEDKTRFSLAPRQTRIGISPRGISEEFSLEGHRSLYGATKLSSELLIREFSQFYQFRSVINRCGVLAGPWQMGKVDQGVIALWVAHHFWKRPLSYIGYGGQGKQVRDILYVDDMFELVDYQINHMETMNGQTFNVGGGADNSLSLQELTVLCRKQTGESIDIQEVKENRPADIRIYITDNSKVNQMTGWKPKTPCQEIVKQIHQWIKENEKSLRPILGN